jgi:regulatory protein
MREEESLEAGARRRALQYLTRREHSTREVQTYLKRKGFDDETASRVTDSLRNSGLIDDARLAEIIVRDGPGRGWGAARVRQELLRRGIGRDMVEEIARQLFAEDDFDLALALGRKKWPSCRGEERAREARLAGYLTRKGFSSSTIIRVLKVLESETVEDEPLP